MRDALPATPEMLLYHAPSCNMYRHTCAMSSLIPLGLSLNVGGKSDNRAKFIVCPAAAPPSSVIVNRLAVDGGDIVGMRVALTFSQEVCDPDTGT